MIGLLALAIDPFRILSIGLSGIPHGRIGKTMFHD
jgi:hypothetical protein